MKVTLVWRDCTLENGDWGKTKRDSYWVETNDDELESILSLSTNRSELTSELEVNNDGSGKHYFLVSNDLQSIWCYPAHYPYAGQWNAYNPFNQISAIQIDDLDSIRTLEPKLLAQPENS